MSSGYSFSAFEVAKALRAPLVDFRQTSDDEVHVLLDAAAAELRRWTA